MTRSAVRGEGVTPSPRTALRVTKTGTYYVSIEAPDLPDPTDPQTAGDKVVPQTTYTLTLRATKSAKKKAKKKSKKK